MSGRDTDGKTVDDLVGVMAALRTPGSGCPWDLEQDFKSIAPYTIEEAYEVADAIEREDMEGLKDELGDLLLQVVYHARMASEIGAFAFEDVVEAIVRKMMRRHPHVFGDADVGSAAELTGLWERIKREERLERGAEHGGGDAGVLDGVPRNLPAPARALKLQDRAAKVGFDWPGLGPVLAKVREEIDEIEAAVAVGAGASELKAEIGDALFALVNAARHLKVDPDAALRGANGKFERRFRRIEALLSAQGRTPLDSDLDEMDKLWERAKSEEREA